MRIAVLGTPRSGTDPRTVRLVVSLGDAGHDVAFMSSGAVDPRIEESAMRTIRLNTRWPSGAGRVGGLIRRFNPRRMRSRNMHTHAVSVLDDFQPDLVYTADATLAMLADDFGFSVATDAKSPAGIANIAATLAPEDPNLAAYDDHHQIPWVERPLSTPALGRHEGARVVLCYHPTTTTPARYLHAALERAGVAVDHKYPNLDLSDIQPDVSAVLIVESPYPAVQVSGETSVPVLFWVHHGEIHLYQNIRLAERYQADGVLLAHSWHLAHRFRQPVFRFPFGVPTEMLSGPIPYAERPLDVAMVASGFDDTGDRYATRRRIADELTGALGPERVLFRGELSPIEMFEVYDRSKAVIDEGGSLHRPITMRVFEATGSGAALVTDPAPGIELLYEPDAEFVALDTEDPLRSTSGDRDHSQIAAAGQARALGVHTYDHRVDELFSILEQLGSRIPLARRGAPRLSPLKGGRQTATSPFQGGRQTAEESGRFLAAVGRFAEIDTIACADRGAAPFGSSSYVVWSHADVTQRHIFVDAVVLDDPSTPSLQLMQQAHRFVFSSELHAPTVATMLTDAGRTFTEIIMGDVRVFDFETPGYIVRDTP